MDIFYILGQNETDRLKLNRKPTKQTIILAELREEDESSMDTSPDRSELSDNTATNGAQANPLEDATNTPPTGGPAPSSAISRLSPIAPQQQQQLSRRRHPLASLPGLVIYHWKRDLPSYYTIPASKNTFPQYSAPVTTINITGIDSIRSDISTGPTVGN
ncbi:hypothetical protein BGX21_002826 [Mortierella sp. AD011]|nr:hypothetical protein BGX21_002826 [Mortierella sp. AD011]